MHCVAYHGLGNFSPAPSLPETSTTGLDFPSVGLRNATCEEQLHEKEPLVNDHLTEPLCIMHMTELASVPYPRGTGAHE